MRAPPIFLTLVFGVAPVARPSASATKVALVATVSSASDSGSITNSAPSKDA
jgi:hypothetical protein